MDIATLEHDISMMEYIPLRTNFEDMGEFKRFIIRGSNIVNSGPYKKEEKEMFAHLAGSYTLMVAYFRLVEDIASRIDEDYSMPEELALEINCHFQENSRWVNADLNRKIDLPMEGETTVQICYYRDEVIKPEVNLYLLDPSRKFSPSLIKGSIEGMVKDIQKYLTRGWAELPFSL